MTPAFYALLVGFAVLAGVCGYLLVENRRAASVISLFLDRTSSGISDLRNVIEEQARGLADVRREILAESGVSADRDQQLSLAIEGIESRLDSAEQKLDIPKARRRWQGTFTQGRQMAEAGERKRAAERGATVPA